MEAQILIDAIAGIPDAKTMAQLLRLAGKVDQAAGPAEFNFPAEVIMHLDVTGLTGSVDESAIRKSAEQAMLQLAFFNLGENPPCSFIMVCHLNGWRAGGAGLVNPSIQEGPHGQA